MKDGSDRYHRVPVDRGDVVVALVLPGVSNGKPAKPQVPHAAASPSFGAFVLC